MRSRPLSKDEIENLAAYEIFETEAGKKVLEDLDDSFGDLSYVPGAMDFKAGQAHVVREIRARIEIAKNPGKYEQVKDKEESGG